MTTPTSPPRAPPPIQTEDDSSQTDLRRELPRLNVHAAIRTRAADRYLDVTLLCRALGGSWPNSQWLRYIASDRGRRFMNAMSATSGLPMSALVLADADAQVWLHRYCAFHFITTAFSEEHLPRLMRDLVVSLETVVDPVSERLRIEQRSKMQLDLMREYFHSGTIPGVSDEQRQTMERLCGNIRSLSRPLAAGHPMGGKGLGDAPSGPRAPILPPPSPPVTSPFATGAPGFDSPKRRAAPTHDSAVRRALRGIFRPRRQS